MVGPQYFLCPTPTFNSLQAINLPEATKLEQRRLFGQGCRRLDSVVAARSGNLPELDSYETPHQRRLLWRCGLGRFGQRRPFSRTWSFCQRPARNYLDLVALSMPQTEAGCRRTAGRCLKSAPSAAAAATCLNRAKLAVIADVTGDGKNDLVILVHDRITRLSAGMIYFFNCGSAGRANALKVRSVWRSAAA